MNHACRAQEEIHERSHQCRIDRWFVDERFREDSEAGGLKMRPSANLEKPMSDLAVTKSDYDDVRMHTTRRKILRRLLALGLPVASFIVGYYSTMGRFPEGWTYPFIGGASVSVPFGYRRRLTIIGTAIASVAALLIGAYLGQAYANGVTVSPRYCVFYRSSVLEGLRKSQQAGGLKNAR